MPFGDQMTLVRHAGQLVNYVHSQHNPAANTKATITRAAGAAGVRNVGVGFCVYFMAGATAPTATQITVALIDGASGGTTYLWGPVVIGIPATAGATTGFIVGTCWKMGSTATGMTLEFSAAGGANTIESVDFDSVQIYE